MSPGHYIAAALDAGNDLYVRPEAVHAGEPR